MIVTHRCIGEHIPAIVAHDISAWLRQCLARKISPARLRRRWGRFCVDGERDAPPGASSHHEPWLDYLATDDTRKTIPDFYAACYDTATTIVTYDHDACMFLVAVQGDCTIKEIVEALSPGALFDPSMANTDLLVC